MNLSTQLDVKMVPRGADPSDPWPAERRMLEANAERNGFDPEVLSYPCTVMLKCEYGVMPIQSALVFESIALRDNLTLVERAQAVLNLTAAAQRLAIDSGMREAYSIVTDVATAKAAIAVGYEVLPYQVIRKRLKVDGEGNQI